MSSGVREAAQSVPQSARRRESALAHRASVLDFKRLPCDRSGCSCSRALPVAADARGTLAGLPGLARIVSRARTASLPDMDLESALLDSFGVQRQRDWPVAPFSWLGEGGEAGARYWLRADPVHLRAERDAVLLVDARHFRSRRSPPTP